MSTLILGGGSSVLLQGQPTVRRSHQAADYPVSSTIRHVVGDAGWRSWARPVKFPDRKCSKRLGPSAIVDPLGQLGGSGTHLFQVGWGNRECLVESVTRFGSPSINENAVDAVFEQIPGCTDPLRTQQWEPTGNGLVHRESPRLELWHVDEPVGRCIEARQLCVWLITSKGDTVTPGLATQLFYPCTVRTVTHQNKACRRVFGGDGKEGLDNSLRSFPLDKLDHGHEDRTILWVDTHNRASQFVSLEAPFRSVGGDTVVVNHVGHYQDALLVDAAFDQMFACGVAGGTKAKPNLSQAAQDNSSRLGAVALSLREARRVGGI